MTGTVAYFEGSFGFITPDDGGKDVFVHQTAILADGFRRLWAGQRATFDVEQGPRGPIAARVEVVEGGAMEA